MDNLYRLHNIKECEKALTHSKMTEYLNAVNIRYPKLFKIDIGHSILHRSIPMLTMGEGGNAILYVASHHAMEWPTSVLILRFICDICTEYYDNDGKIYGLDLKEAFRNSRFFFVPMLNPDGIELQINGLDRSCVLSERQYKMNNNSEDFSHWQANARGVDLNHNYDAGFYEYKKLENEAGILSGGPTRYSGEYPESEPECLCLCNLIRVIKPKRIYTLHTQGEEIFYSSGEAELSGGREIGEKLAKISTYTLSKPDGLACYGGLTDWAIQKMKIQSYTIECGKGKNPLPASDIDEMYEKLKKMLFVSLTL